MRMSKAEIVICMGSSCFARGNSRNLELLQAFLKRRGLEEEVLLRGSRCEGHCLVGPNITIRGETFNRVFPENLEELLERFFPLEGDRRS